LLTRFDQAFARQRLKGDEQRASPVTLVFIINALGLSRSHLKRHGHFAQELHGQFIEADNRALFVKAQVVEMK